MASDEAMTTVWDDVRARAERFDDWRRRLVAELPDTMQRLREGAANFQVVSQRLAKTSESLEEVTALYESTIADTTCRSAEAADALRSQIEILVAQSPDRMSSTLAEMQRTFESLAELNPLWLAHPASVPAPTSERPPGRGDEPHPPKEP